MSIAIVTAVRRRTITLEPLASVGQVVVAVSLAAFGIQQFLWGDFVPGRAPAYPAGVPGRLVWAWLSGAGLLATAAALLGALVRPTPRVVAAARIGAVLAAAAILLWAGLRQLPVVVASQMLSGEWTKLGKALMLTGGTLAGAGALPQAARAGGLLNATDAFVHAGRITLAAFFILCGIQHFIWTDFVATLVPAWIPGPYFWTWFAGIALIAGGAGMLVPLTAALASRLSALMVFLWVPMLHVPRAFAALDAASRRNEWTAVFEALAVSGIALIVAELPSRRR